MKYYNTICLLYLFAFLLFGCKNASKNTLNVDQLTDNKEISGYWEWINNPNNKDIPDAVFSLNIEKVTNNEIKAQYCAIASRGSKIDCSNEKDYNVSGIIDNGIAKISFFSFFDAKKGSAKIQVIDSKSILWEIITLPTGGESYAPKKAILKKVVRKKNVEAKKNVIELPLDKENLNKKEYPRLDKAKYDEVSKLIKKNYPDVYEIADIIQIKNTMNFDTFIYFVEADSSFSSIINVRDNTIIFSEGISYEIPNKDTYESFVIRKDYSILVYEIDYKTRSKSPEPIEKFQIQKDGSIRKIFSHRKKVDPSSFSAPD